MSSTSLSTADQRVHHLHSAVSRTSLSTACCAVTRTFLCSTVQCQEDFYAVMTLHSSNVETHAVDHVYTTSCWRIVYVCICMYICIYVCIYMYIRYMCICVYVYIYIYIYIHIYPLHMRSYWLLADGVCMCMYVYVYICVYIYVYMYIYVCTLLHCALCLLP